MAVKRPLYHFYLSHFFSPPDEHLIVYYCHSERDEESLLGDVAVELERRKVFLINLLYWAAMLGITFLVFKYLLGFIMPFLMALLFSSMLRPAWRFLVKKLRFLEKPAPIIVTLLFFGTLGFLFVFIAVRIVSAVNDLFGMMPGIYQDTIAPGLTSLMSGLEEFAGRFDISLLDTFNELGPSIIDSLGDAVSAVSSAVGAWATALVMGTPRFLVSFIVMIIATFFMAADYERMSAFIFGHLPEKARKITIDVKNSFVRVLGRYGRSYAIIMVVTFVEVTLGMLILGYGNPLLIGLIVAVFDIFPVLGTGMILGPWAIIEFIRGEYLQALGLIIVYLFVTVVRQIMEPRIVGNHVGLHPLVTIMAIFIGGSLFGVVGFFGLPITIAILKSLSDEGVITIFRRAGDSKPSVETAVADAVDDEENSE